MENLDKFIGKTISTVVLTTEDKICFTFTDGTEMTLYDTGQQCCESRYMTTDDDLTSFSGNVLLGIEIKSCGSKEFYDEIMHDIQFLEVITNKGCITFAAHNDHNGYYSGFEIGLQFEGMYDES